MELFKELSQGGGFTIHHLVHLHNVENTMHVYLCDDNVSLEYEDKIYLASNFTYNVDMDTSAKLDIELVKGGNAIINLLQTSTDNLVCEVKEIFTKNNESVKILEFIHRYGSATWNRQEANFTFEKDDRIDMTFPGLIWDKYSNRGN